MANERTIFLFGSGATLAWGSPTTLDLTNLVREHSFKTTDNRSITEFIYTKLIDNGYSGTDVNFETIISVIEELIVYYSQFDGDTRDPSLSSVFFASPYEKELLNYSIEGGTPRHGYLLQIPSGERYPLSKPAFHKETPSQMFFQHLLSLLLTNITAEIHRYAYHTAGHPMTTLDSDTSKSFVGWMKLLSGKSMLRLYTLNYERIFKILLARAGMDVFEGFDCGEYVEGAYPIRANVCRIQSDTESHIHYNLHGSAFWEVLPLDKKQLPNPEIVLSPLFGLPSANEPASVQMEKGRTLLFTNIITGYQKAQRGMITPFKQMQAAFDRDCTLADEVYVIGYSFGDEHINESLKTALRHNRKLRVTIVDPQFIKNKMDYELAIRLFSFMHDDNMRPEKVEDHLYRYFGGAVTVHEIGFEEFLESQF